MSKFKIGDSVRKIEGYPFVGKVVAVYENELKCSVRHVDGWDHIFHDKQLAYNHPEYQYLDLLKDVLNNGAYREGRNGGTYGVFGRQIRFNLEEGFPLLTTKKIHWKSVAVELLWFLRGDTNIKYLNDRGVSIWDEWAGVDGSLGDVYGAQWRFWMAPSKVVFIENDEGSSQIYVSDIENRFRPVKGNYGFGTIDQISNVIDGLKKDPYGRRHIVSAWNPDAIPNMALPPCHCLFQFFVNDGKLSCQLYQRSADLFLGVPFNIASYALLTHLIAREVGLKVGEFVHTFGDLHLYANHVEQAKLQMTRTPHPFPYINIQCDKSIFDLEFEDINLMHYSSHPTIKADISV